MNQLNELDLKEIKKENESLKEEIKNIYKDIKKMNFQINKKEDDIKNIMQEKDTIINELNEKLKTQEKMIKENQASIMNLTSKLNEININNLTKNLIDEKKLLLKDIDSKYNELKIISNDISISLNDKINQEINLLNKKNENYITLKVYINNEKKYKDVIFLKQFINNNYLKNFDICDIEIFVDDKRVGLKYKKLSSYNYDKESKNCDKAQEINFILLEPICLYWNFKKE